MISLKLSEKDGVEAFNKGLVPWLVETIAGYRVTSVRKSTDGTAQFLIDLNEKEPAEEQGGGSD